jgi:hypothetical protein
MSKTLTKEQLEKKLLSAGFKEIFEDKCETVKAFLKEEIKQPIMLIDHFSITDEDESQKTEETFKMIDLIKNENLFNKKTIGVIFDTDTDEKELLTDHYFFLKIIPKYIDIIPLERRDITIKFIELDEPQKGFQFDPYKDLVLNLIDLLREIKKTNKDILEYKYPKALRDEMRYLKYFSGTVVESTKFKMISP